jgi:hypothetical protein
MDGAAANLGRQLRWQEISDAVIDLGGGMSGRSSDLR